MVAIPGHLRHRRHLHQRPQRARWTGFLEYHEQRAESVLGRFLGGDQLHVVVADPADLDEVTRVVGEITGARPSVDVAERSVTAPTDGGAAAIAALASALVDAGVQVDDLGLRQPTLDDVFLTLTGASPEYDDDGAAPSALAMEDAR